jgi:antitoxin (DNA-binding transcriptional repressor) of toxin-antitoxin stability system
MMKAVTTHQAKTHLSRLLKEVQTGETIVILSAAYRWLN